MNKGCHFMLTVYLCDDNKIILEKYANLLHKLASKNKIEININLFTSGEQLVFHLAEYPNQADMIYLDIVMGKMNGIQTAKELREMGCRAEIVFLTSSNEYVFDSFDISPMHYILKEQTSLSKFEEIFLKAVTLCKQKTRKFFYCESGNVKKQIPMDQISYFEVNNRVITVHYGNHESFDFYSSLEKIETDLKTHDFLRTHRSFIIHLKYIDRIEKNKITLFTGEEIPLGATYTKQIKLAFSKYLTRNI